MSNLIQVRPIRTDQDYEAAVARIGELMDAAPNTVEGDELDVLATLADVYQKERFPRAGSNPVDIVRMLMQEHGLKASGMAIYFGEEARVSEFLNGKRELTVEQIRRISEAFHIPPTLLLGKSERRWRVPRNRRQYVYDVAKRIRQGDGSTMFKLVEHFTGERGPWITRDKRGSTFQELNTCSCVYGPPDGKGDFFQCEVEGDEAFVTGYSR